MNMKLVFFGLIALVATLALGFAITLFFANRQRRQYRRESRLPGLNPFNGSETEEEVFEAEPVNTEPVREQRDWRGMIFGHLERILKTLSNLVSFFSQSLALYSVNFFEWLERRRNRFNPTAQQQPQHHNQGPTPTVAAGLIGGTVAEEDGEETEGRPRNRHDFLWVAGIAAIVISPFLLMVSAKLAALVAVLGFCSLFLSWGHRSKPYSIRRLLVYSTLAVALIVGASFYLRSHYGPQSKVPATSENRR